VNLCSYSLNCHVGAMVVFHMLCRITQSSDAHRTESVSVMNHEQTMGVNSRVLDQKLAISRCSPRHTYPVIYYVCQTWWLVSVCVRCHRRSSLYRRHAFPLPVTALSPWLRRGHGTACRDLSHRYLHWRPLDVS